MPTVIILVRIAVCFALFCAPLLFYVIASRKPENALWFLFPMFGGVPAILGALLVFVPLEGLLQARGLGHLKNVAVPLSGSLFVLIFLFVSCVVSGHFFTRLKRILNGGSQMTVSLLFWSFLGVLWGVSWRLSDWAVRSVGLLILSGC
jgi:hypothetical protein